MQIDMKQPILDKNDKLAKSNRELFAEKKVFVLDLLASPGSGKTSTILATIEALRDEFNIAVIEGDIASSVDSEKIKAQGIAAVQINTGGACHLESDMIRRAVDDVPLAGVRALDLMHRTNDIIKRLPVPHRIVPVVFNAHGDPHPAGELLAQLPEHGCIGQLVPDAEVGKVHVGMPGKAYVGESQLPGCFRHRTEQGRYLARVHVRQRPVL